MKGIDSFILLDTFMESKGEWHSSKDRWGAEVWGEYKPNNYIASWNLLIEVINKIKQVSNEDSFLELLSISNLEEIMKLQNRLNMCFTSDEKINVFSVCSICTEIVIFHNKFARTK